MITKNNFAKIEKWLFEYSPDILAGNLDDAPEESTLGQETPIAPIDHMAMQLTRELPPIEDEEYIPASIKELSAACDLIASKCPDDQVEYFYEQILKLLESAIEISNNPKLSDTSLLIGDNEIARPIRVQKEARYGARQRDAARKWKQGDDLELYRPEDDDYGDDDLEFHPDAEDLMDFMSANDEEDATKIYGATPETAEQANKEYSLADILKSDIYPKASIESAITNKLEREMFSILRATESAPQVSDRLSSLVKSEYAIEAFIDSMYHGDLLSDESLEDLEKNPDLVKASSMFGYFTSIAFVKPTIKELQKLADMGPDVFDPKKKKSQISPDDADRIIKSVKAAWERKNASQKSKIAQKAITHMGEFEGRDKSVMG